MPRISNTNVCAGVFSEQERYKFNKLAIFLSLAILLIHLLLKFNVFEASAKTDFSSESGQFFYGKACSADLLDSLREKGSILEPVFFCFLVSNFDSFIGILYGNLGQPLNYLIMAITALAISFMAIKVLSGKAKLDSEFFTLIGKIALIFSLSLSYDSLATLCNFMRSIIMGLSDVVADGINSIPSLPTGKFCDAGTAKTAIGEIECMIRGLLVKSGMVLIATFVLWFLDIGLGVDLTLKVLALFVTLIFVAVRIMAFYFLSFVSICMLLVFLPIFGTMWFFQIGKKPFQTYTNLLITNMLFPVLMIILLSFTFLAVKESWLKTVKLIESFEGQFKPVEVVSVFLQNALGGLFGSKGMYETLNTPEEKIGKASWYGPADGVSGPNPFYNGKTACGIKYEKYGLYGFALDQSDGRDKYCHKLAKVTNLDNCLYTYARMVDTGRFKKYGKTYDFTFALAKDLKMNNLDEDGECPPRKCTGVANQVQTLFGPRISEKSKCAASEKPTDLLAAFCNKGSFGQFGSVQSSLSSAANVLKPVVDICDLTGTGTLPNNQANAGNKGLSGISSLGCTSPIPESVKGCIYAMGPEDRTIVKTELSKIDKESISDDEKKKKKQTYLKDVYNDLFNNYTPTNKRDGKIKGISGPQDDTFNVCIKKINNFLYERSGAGNESVKKCWELFDLYNIRGADDAIVKAKLKDKASVDYCLSKDSCSGDLRSCMIKYLNDPMIKQGDVDNTDCAKLIYNKKPISTVIEGRVVSLKNVDFIEERCLAMDICARTDGFLDSLDKTNPDQKIEDTGTAKPQQISNEEFGDLTGTLSIPLPTNLDQFRELAVRIVVIILIMLIGNQALSNETFSKLFNKDTKIYDAVSENFKEVEKFVNNNPNAQQVVSGEKTGLIKRASAAIGRTRNR